MPMGWLEIKALSADKQKAAVNDSLLAFMQQAQGFDKTLFGVKDG
jgi:hypothetical protein